MSQTDESKLLGLEYAFKYFDLHAKQRMSVFNFFIVLSGIISAGLATSIQGPDKISILGIFLGVLLILLAVVFWKLDQRTSFLIKHSEDCLEKLEVDLLPESARLIASEPDKYKKHKTGMKIIESPWTYSRSLRTIFLAMGLFGFLGAVMAGSRVYRSLSTDEAARSTAHVAAEGSIERASYDRTTFSSTEPKIDGK